MRNGRRGPRETVDVVVAGVPRSLHAPFADGRWLRPAHVAGIEGVSPGIRLVHTSRADLEQGKLPVNGAEVLLLEAGSDAGYDFEIPAACVARLVTPRLRWVQACSSGIGHLLDMQVLPPGIALSNAAGVHSQALAESVLAAVLFHAKRLAERLDDQRARRWRMLHCIELEHKTLCILGTGHIGAAVARRARAFGMRVVGVRRHPRATDDVDEVVGPDGLHDVLPRTDYLVIACPLTPETDALIDARAMSTLKRGAYLINVSRGRIVEEQALLGALRSGRLAGAFLDAHPVEPLPADHPYWDTPGITLIPHDSHSSPRIGDNIVALFVENLSHYLRGEPLRNVVDPARGY